MKQFTYKFFCLLGFLLIGEGNLTAQNLTQVTSLAEIDNASKYVLKYNGNAYGGDSFYKNYKTACYFYYNGSAMAATTTTPSGDNSYYFTLEADAANNTLRIKSLNADKYISATNTPSLVTVESGTNIDWTVDIKNSNFFIYCLSGLYWRFIVGYYASSSLNGIQTQTAGKSGTQKTDNMYCIEIYKVEETKKASFYYYDANKTLLNTVSYDANLSDISSENTLSNLTKKYPAYISATYYLDDSFTEGKKLDESYEVTDNATFYVVTTYNEKFPFPTNSDTYFALSTGGCYLGITNGTSMTYENRNNYALRLQGNWYDKYKIVNHEGNVLDASNQFNIIWKSPSESTYLWTIDDNGKIKDTENNNYLSIGNNCLLTSSSSSDESSNAAAVSILSDLTAEYVGAYDKSQTGTVTFDDLVKGNNALDFTNGTYYFIETATDASTVLSSSDAKTTFGGAPTSATLATNASKGFNELWQYQDGYFVHANSGLKLTASALDASGTVWHKTATGTALAYKLNNGTADFTAAENDTWKFRLAKSVTISLTGKNGTSYATTCAPVALTLPEDDTDTKLYIEKSHTENSLSVVPATAVAANTGIYIENTSGATSATLLFTESGAEPSAETPILHGTNVTLDISSDDHSFYRTLGFNSADKIGFFKPSNSIDLIPANRAFLHFTSAPTSAFYIDFDGTTTGIDTLLPTAAAELDQNAPVYDLSGRRMQGTLRTGIYLQNGRKFMVK